MGVCCCNSNNVEKTNLGEDEESMQMNTVVVTNNNLLPTDGKKNENESNQKMNNKWGQQKDTLYAKNNIDLPDTIDEVYLDNKSQNSISISIINENEINLDLSKMENNLFDLINNLRSNPQSFINYIEKYRDKVVSDNEKEYIIIDDNKFEFENKECFDECIEFLKNHKKLEKFEKIQSMFECKKFFVVKNVKDSYFVVTYNLINANNSDENKIRRNCLMSEEYNKLNITITKNEMGNKLYSYYFSFDKI